MDQLKINGLKSHDYHIFIERLLPVVMRGFVKNEIWESLAELSYFFRVLCAKEVDRAQILQLEANIPIILCKLEKIFPPGFFNPMEHLKVHLPYQVRVGGPVKYTWMYGIEGINSELFFPPFWLTMGNELIMAASRVEAKSCLCNGC